MASGGIKNCKGWSTAVAYTCVLVVDLESVQNFYRRTIVSHSLNDKDDGMTIVAILKFLNDCFVTENNGSGRYVSWWIYELIKVAGSPRSLDQITQRSLDKAYAVVNIFI